MLSNPTRYGLIACRHLVRDWHNNVWLNTPEIAERYRMNVRALSPALRRLVMVGILCSQCGGTRPGFMFNHAPEEVTMLEVVRALKGNFRMDCYRTVLPCVQCSCETDSCRVCGVFRDMLDKFRSQLSSVSLEDHAATEEFSWGGGKTLQANKMTNRSKNTG